MKQEDKKMYVGFGITTIGIYFWVNALLSPFVFEERFIRMILGIVLMFGGYFISSPILKKK